MKLSLTSRWIKRSVFAILGLGIIYAAIILTPWSVGLCGEEPVAEAYSPNGTYLARAYVRDCGATTGYMTHVNLLSKWDYFNTRWIGTIDQGLVFGNGCLSKVDLVWIDDSHLEISYLLCQPTENRADFVFRKSESWNGITVTYRGVPRTE